MEDIVRTVKGDPGLVLEAANKLHPNLQFTIEDFDSKRQISGAQIIFYKKKIENMHVISQNFFCS